MAEHGLSAQDRRWLDACLRYARRHTGLTRANPSVGCLLVSHDGRVVGRGITAIGGRPHAERVAINEAGESARGTTAYVTLEPCAHHGATPPCAQALIDSKVKRVVTAWIDPDRRVDGRGHAMLREAGIEVDIAGGDNSAPDDLAGYLTRKQKNRPQVILKLAVSADGKIGLAGKEITITGPLARAYVHRMRAQIDAILVGRATVDADDPMLDCRLPGLGSRSPARFVLDSGASLSPQSALARSAGTIPTYLISADPLPKSLQRTGLRRLAAERVRDGLALPEILEDMAALGMSSLLVEGGAKTAQGFLDAGLVDEIALFTAPHSIGEEGIASPVTEAHIPRGFGLRQTLQLADDRLTLWTKD